MKPLHQHPLALIIGLLLLSFGLSTAGAIRSAIRAREGRLTGIPQGAPLGSLGAPTSPSRTAKHSSSDLVSDGAREGAANYGQMRDFLLALADVSETTSLGTPAFQLRDELFVWLLEDGDTVVVNLPLAERDVLIEADPDAFFTTDDYRNRPMVLMRLSGLEAKPLEEVLEMSWTLLSSAQRQ